MPTQQENVFNTEATSDSLNKLKEEMSQLKSQLPMTFGQKLVGLNFNPSNDDKVSKAKRLCAELADLVMDEWNIPSEKTDLQRRLLDHTFGEILNAQMNVVKLLTLKY